MRRTLKFYKNIDGTWFVDLPEWEGSVLDLQLVSGADTFLDILSQGDNEIFATLSSKKMNGDKLVFTRFDESGEGAWYLLETYKGISYDLNMWLCNVTEFVFGEFPEIIYFNVN